MDIKDIKSEEMQVVEMLEKAKTSPEEMQKLRQQNDNQPKRLKK